jgi:phosphate transport system protein
MKMAEHTDRRFEEDLARLRKVILEMGGLVERQIGCAIDALATSDRELATKTIERDHEVNRYDVEVDDECMRILALHQPAAGDLRFIITGLRITTDLERIGDMAVNISERALDLVALPTLSGLQIDLPRMGEIARKMLRESLDAFVRGDVDLALAVCKEDDVIDTMHGQMFREGLELMARNAALIVPVTAQLFVSKYLERIADHATNIGEMVIFMVKGKSIRHLSVVPSTI